MIKFRVSSLAMGILALSALSACTFTRESLLTTSIHNTHSLKKNSGNENFTEPMQLMYALYSPPMNQSNNLQNFNAFTYTNPNSTQDALQAASITTSLLSGNPLKALTYGTLVQINKTVPSGAYRTNKLILMAPLEVDPDSSEETLQKSIGKTTDKLYIRSIQMIKEAYKDAGTPVEHVEVDPSLRLGYIPLIEPTYLLPKGQTYCPKHSESIDKMTDSELRYCSTIVFNFALVYLDNTDAKLALKGNFVAMSTPLPDLFPVDKLHTNQPYSYLYAPPIFYRISDVLSKLSGKQMDSLYQQGRFTLNPYIRNLNTGEYMYFNPKLSKLQKNKFSKIDEKS